MKKGSKLASILTGTALVVAPTISGYAQAPQEPVMPLKGSTYVSTNVIPVKNLKKTIDYQTLKPVEELQEETVSYIDRSEGIQKGYAYVPSEDKLYDKPSSDIIRNEDANGDRSVTSFPGDGYLDAYSQHYWTQGGNFHLDYYGSGDMDGDNIYTLNDRDLILGSTEDWADTDFDGNPGTSNDILTYEMFYTDQIPRLPAHFEYHQTPAEKINTIEKVLAIDQTNAIPPGPNWVCTQYAAQTEMNTDGVWNLSGAPLNWSVGYDSTMNGRFNIPVYRMSTIYENGDGHVINSILIDNSFTDFAGSWYSFEPQTDQRQYGGDASLNYFANIKKYAYYWSDFAGAYIYNLEPLINFDLDNNGQQIGHNIINPEVITSQPIEKTYVQENIGGQKPADITVNVEDGTDPSVTGEATGYADWAIAYWSDDSTTQAGGTWDPENYNYQLFRSWKAASDSNGVINDTTYGHVNPIYNRPAQIITVQDTTKPYFTSVFGNQSMDYTNWLNNGIPLSEGADNSGVFAINRSMVSGQGANPDSCDFWTFPVDVTDSIYDPSGNWRVENFTVGVEMDDSYFTNFPSPAQTEFTEDEITPNMTGGLPGAANPTGVQVFVDQNPDKINNTQNPDPMVKEHYWYGFDWNHNASDSVCVNPIYQTQHVTVVETNPPYWTHVRPDTLVEEGTNLHPDNLGWSVAADSITPVTPDVTYEDELIEEIPEVQRLWERHWYAEDLSGTNAPDTSTFITEDLTTGIRRNLGSLEKKLNFYPNPTSGIFKMKYQAEHPSRVAAEIYDVTGRLVDNSIDTYLPGESELKFDISDKAPGLYFVQLSVDGVPIFQDKINNRVMKK